MFARYLVAAARKVTNESISAYLFEHVNGFCHSVGLVFMSHRFPSPNMFLLTFPPVVDGAQLNALDPATSHCPPFRTESYPPYPSDELWPQLSTSVSCPSAFLSDIAHLIQICLWVPNGMNIQNSSASLMTSPSDLSPRILFFRLYSQPSLRPQTLHLSRRLALVQPRQTHPQYEPNAG